MKTILPLVLLLGLVSCSHTPPAYVTVKPAARKEPVPSTLAPVKTPAPVDTNTLIKVANEAATNTLRSALPVPEPVPPGSATSNVSSAVRTAPPSSPAEARTSSTGSRPTPPRPDEIIPAGTINFQNTDLNQVLQIYSELVNRTVLRPANLGAPQIVLKTQTPLTKREAVEALDAVLALNGIAVINVGEKFVKAVPVAQAPQEGQARDQRDPAEMADLGQYVTHVVQLKYTKPSEMVQVLQPFAKAPNSILPIDSSQILVLRDYTENVKRMLEMIKDIDVSVPSEFVSEVIPIKYAKAEEIQSALNSLTGGGGGGGTTIGRSNTGPGRSGGTGFTRGGVGTTGYTPGSTPFGTQNAMGTTTPGAAGTTAPGGSFQDRLRNIIQKASASGELQILGQTKIIADERSNSLLIFATRQDMDMIKNIVSKLDVVLAQVLIETVIMDVTIDKGWSFGVSGAQAPTDNRHTAGAINNGQPFLDFVNSTATNIFSLASLPGGFSYWAQLGKSFDLALQAAATDERINVIQRPQILTTHATPASIFIGNTVPYITSTYYGGGYAGGPSSSYQQLQVGIGLTVTPYINADGLVVMEIDESIDEISGSTRITGVGDVPNTNSRKLSAQVAVRDGDTIMLGGIIRNSSDRKNSGVPILKDIPLLGPLFSTRSDSKERKELLVLMRPTVLRTPDVAALATAAQKKRLPGISSAESEVREEERKELKQEQKDIRWRERHQTPLTPEQERLLNGTPVPTAPQSTNSQ